MCIKRFEIFNEKLNYNKLTFSIAGRAWNELWDKEIFKWVGKHPNIVITNEYDENEDLGYFRVMVFDDNEKRYVIKGNKYFRGTEEDRKIFLDWINSLNLIEK